MSEPDVNILFEQGPCLVVLKPGGLLTQAPIEIDSLERRIKHFIKQRDDKPGKVYLGVPHRLDRPVSGAMVFARHVRAARRLSDQFQGRMVRKVYWAVVAGRVEPAEDEWTDWMRKIPDVAAAELVPRKHAESRQAVLRYRVCAHLDGASWLRIELETGRMHQIRLQAGSRGHPVLGDAQYGSSATFGPPVDDPRRRWIALHGRSLAFRHPMTRDPVEVVAPLPPCWAPLKLPPVGHVS